MLSGSMYSCLLIFKKCSFPLFLYCSGLISSNTFNFCPMQEMLSFLSSVHPLPPELWEHLGSIIQVKSLKKKEILLNRGQICRNIYFVQWGLFRCYYLE